MSGNIIIDSKFRRETSNFKVNFDASSVDRGSETPVLIKYIEKNLKPEELLGVITSVPGPRAPLICSIAAVGVDAETGAYTLELSVSFGMEFYYVPSTGALSLNGPYVETEENTADDEGLPVGGFAGDSSTPGGAA